MPVTVVGEKKIGDECARRLMGKKGDTTFDWENVPPWWGNSAGLAKMEEHDPLTHRVERLELNFGVLQAENRITKSELRDLKAVSKPYLDVRNRWISNFIKNKAKELLTPTDEAIIRTGNSASHHGDPLTDAWVYSENMRVDISTYRDFYGIGPEQVMNYCRFNKCIFYLPAKIMPSVGRERKQSESPGGSRQPCHCESRYGDKISAPHFLPELQEFCG